MKATHAIPGMCSSPGRLRALFASHLLSAFMSQMSVRQNHRARWPSGPRRPSSMVPASRGGSIPYPFPADGGVCRPVCP